MKKRDLIKSLQNDNRSEKICAEAIDATFELLSSLVNLEQTLTIDGIGVFDAHYRQGANRELPNEQGVLEQKNLSVYFHPSSRIKKRVNKLAQDASAD